MAVSPALSGDPSAASPAACADPVASIDQLDEAIGRLCMEISSAGYRLLLLIREFDERLGWAQWSFPSGSEWLAWRCGITLSAAREKLRTAHALRGLPQISQAFCEGRLSYSKVRALTRVADEHDEDLLLAYALHATAAQVEERCRQIRNVRPCSIDVARRAWERRSLTLSRNPASGTLTIRAELPLDAGEAIAKALDRAIEAGDAALGPEFSESSWCTQQADALVAVARSYLSGGEADRASAADHYQVVVHVDEAALRGEGGRSDLPIETVRRLACDSSVTTIIEDEQGTPLNVGRKQRLVTTALRRALWARDHGCSFPGCGNTRFVDAHHIRHWSEGGETSLSNTTLLCSWHHRLVHEGTYRIRSDQNGERYFERSDGRVIPRCGYRAEDARPDDVHLQDTSAEGWLAAKVQGTKPSAEVREESPAYRISADHSRFRSDITVHSLQPCGRAGGATTINQAGTRKQAMAPKRQAGSDDLRRTLGNEPSALQVPAYERRAPVDARRTDRSLLRVAVCGTALASHAENRHAAGQRKPVLRYADLEYRHRGSPVQPLPR